MGRWPSWLAGSAGWSELRPIRYGLQSGQHSILSFTFKFSQSYLIIYTFDYPFFIFFVTPSAPRTVSYLSPHSLVPNFWPGRPVSSWGNRVDQISHMDIIVILNFLYTSFKPPAKSALCTLSFQNLVLQVAVSLQRGVHSVLCFSVHVGPGQVWGAINSPWGI